MRIHRVSKSKNKASVDDGVDLTLMDDLIEKYSLVNGKLIPLLQGVQNLYGYIPESAIEKLSEDTDLNLNDIFGVATFYAQFRLAPVGKHVIKMCHGTACHVQNVTAITEMLLDYLDIKDGETTPDKLFTIETVACLGCCSLAPVMMIGDETYGKLDAKSALKIVKNIKREENLLNK